MGATVHASALKALQDLFPSLDPSILSDVLRESGDDLEQSAAALLDKSPGIGPQSSKDQVKASARQGKKLLRTKQPSMGWSALTSQARQTDRPLLQLSQHAKAATPSSDPSAFPELTSSKPSPAHHQQAGSFPLSASHPTVPAKRSGLASTSGQSPWTGAVQGGSRQEGHCAEWQYLEERLSEIHPWADRALLQDILAAAGGSVTSAAWALSELQGPSTPGRSPLASPHVSPKRPAPGSPGLPLAKSCHALGTPNRSPLVSPHVSPRRPAPGSRGLPLAKSGHALGTPNRSPLVSPHVSPRRPAQGSPSKPPSTIGTPSRSPLVSPHQSPQRPAPGRPSISPGPGSEAAFPPHALQRSTALSHRSSPEPGPSLSRGQLIKKADAEPDHATERHPHSHADLDSLRRLTLLDRGIHSGTRDSPMPSASGSARDEEHQDTYHSFRAEALQLTRRWQKAAQKAAAAYSGQDHSAARKCAREARILRAEALAAHAAAAAAIERANNEGRGLDEWTLDLHGLHVTEATAALDRRIEKLEGQLLQTHRKPAELRVITGRGNHSSGGEGSLNRAIASHLVGSHRPHSVQSGAVLVQLRAKRNGH